MPGLPISAMAVLLTGQDVIEKSEIGTLRRKSSSRPSGNLSKKGKRGGKFMACDVMNERGMIAISYGARSIYLRWKGMITGTT